MLNEESRDHYTPSRKRFKKSFRRRARLGKPVMERRYSWRCGDFGGGNDSGYVKAGEQDARVLGYIFAGAWGVGLRRCGNAQLGVAVPRL